MLGLIESGVSPAFMLCTGMWYTHSEQVFRSSLWYSFSGGSNIISPLINYGLGHITGGALRPWQYMYLIAGLATLLWSIILWFVFPGSPQVAKGFTDEERILILERVRSNNAGSENRHFKWYQVREALCSYHFWFILSLHVIQRWQRGSHHIRLHYLQWNGVHCLPVLVTKHANRCIGLYLHPRVWVHWAKGPQLTPLRFEWCMCACYTRELFNVCVLQC